MFHWRGNTVDRDNPYIMGLWSLIIGIQGFLSNFLIFLLHHNFPTTLYIFWNWVHRLILVHKSSKALTKKIQVRHHQKFEFPFFFCQIWKEHKKFHSTTHMITVQNYELKIWFLIIVGYKVESNRLFEFTTSHLRLFRRKYNNYT